MSRTFDRILNTPVGRASRLVLSRCTGRAVMGRSISRISTRARIASWPVRSTWPVLDPLRIPAIALEIAHHVQHSRAARDGLTVL